MVDLLRPIPLVRGQPTPQFLAREPLQATLAKVQLIQADRLQATLEKVQLIQADRLQATLEKVHLIQADQLQAILGKAKPPNRSSKKSVNVTPGKQEYVLSRNMTIV